MGISIKSKTIGNCVSKMISTRWRLPSSTFIIKCSEYNIYLILRGKRKHLSEYLWICCCFFCIIPHFKITWRECARCYASKVPQNIFVYYYYEYIHMCVCCVWYTKLNKKFVCGVTKPCDESSKENHIFLLLFFSVRSNYIWVYTIRTYIVCFSFVCVCV